MRRPTTRSMLAIVAVLPALPLLAIGVTAAVDQDIIVSQYSRKFNPGEVAVRKDTSLVIVNDDGDLLHHAYIESDDFNFDSGDQKPGSRISITFPIRGDFKVLCGIHPKMKLAVHVR